VLVPIFASAVFSQETLTFVLLGLATGSLIALEALGIVLTYRASGVLNFAAGAIGALGAYVAYSIRGDGGNSVLAVAAGLITGALLGLLVHLILVLLRRSSIVAKTIATLGVMVALEGFMQLLYGTSSRQPASFLSTSLVSFTSVITIPADALINIGLVVVLAVVLGIVYKRTLFGLATSAVAEDRQVAAISGWPAWKIELINFMVAGTLSALAAILLAPIVTLDASVLSLIILSALAAALVGRFSSFLIVTGAALLIGVLQSELDLFQTNIATALNVQVPSLTGLSQAVPLVIILVVALTQGRSRLGRGELSIKLPLPGAGRVNPTLIVLGVGIGIAMLYLLSPIWADALIVTFAFAILLLSVVVVTGYTGQLSLGQLAIAGFGAWVAAHLATTYGLSFGLVLILGVMATIPLGVVLALCARRTRGVSLAILTLAFALMINALIFLNGSLTGGFYGIAIKSPTIFGINIDPIVNPARYGTVALVLLTLLGLMVANLRRGKAGRRLLAVRSNERAAASLGVSVSGAKTYAFALAAGIAAVAGIVLAFREPNIDFTQFDAFTSIEVVLLAIIGGIAWSSGSVAGALLAGGALGAQVVNQIFGGSVSNLSSWLLLFSGVNVLLILVKSPDGLAALNSAMLARLRRRKVDRAALGTHAEIGERQTRRVQPASLEARDVSVRFGGVVALDHVSLSVQPGEVVGLIGPNGAGKTALLDLLTGFTSPSGGSVYLDGRDLASESPEKRARAGIIRSWQGVELFDELSVRENLLIAADHKGRWAYLTDLFHPGRQITSAIMHEVVEEFGLAEHLEKRPSTLPQGTARLVGIARTIAAEPRVLLFDEPAAGLASTEITEFAEQIRRIVDVTGIGILLVEHDVGLVASVCDRIVVLDFGKKVAEGTPDEIVNDQSVIDAYLGTVETVEFDAAMVEEM
jgi:ABC-type branched-subunit amino acid transport system ATPase component/ABC-type branched-subunit amino acid transport system permease subunit